MEGMEGNLQPPQALIHGGAADLEAPQPLHSVAQAQTQAVQEADQEQVAFAAAVEKQMQELLDCNGEDASPTSKEDDPNGKAPAPAPATASQWPSRVNWGADMTMLLVSAAAYVDADKGDPELGSRIRRIGKWSLVSSAMAERGFPASPQQCADKFHDLNKRYRRVTELLGYGTACVIVEKPALLEKVKLPKKLKEEARKQLCSKNLHYEQMCSYHNHNKTCLLDDPALQMMLRHFASGSPVGNAEDDDDPMSISDDEEDDESGDDMEVSAEEHRHQGAGHATKKLKHGHEEGSSQGVATTDMKIIQVQRERLKIRRETLEMRQSHLEWMKSRKEQDKELEKMRLDIEMMELGNDKLERELERKIKEMEKMGIKPTKRI